MGIRKNVLAAVLAATLILTGAGCDKKLSSESSNVPDASAQTTLDPLSFTVIDSKMRDYTFGINDYMKNHSEEVTQKVTEGKTINGKEARCVYTVSPDGKYESLQMEKTFESATQVDEYFNMGDSLFIARTTFYNNGNFDPVEKYYIIDGVIYKIDGEASTVTKLADITADTEASLKTEHDLYLSFDEIRQLYA